MPADLSVSSVALDFGNVPLDTVSDPQTITITNTGEADLNLGTLTLVNADAGAYGLMNDLGSDTSLALGSACTVRVVLAPLRLGVLTTMVSIPSNDPDRPIAPPMAFPRRRPPPRCMPRPGAAAASCRRGATTSGVQNGVCLAST